MTSTDTPPAPLEWHPDYRAAPFLLDWLNGAPGYKHAETHITVPDLAGQSHLDDTATIHLRVLTKRRAWGPAPYVGDPFVYLWSYAHDELGRTIAGAARIEYIPKNQLPAGHPEWKP